jgi:uncharacterized repeat protein (TIGR03843 family)
MGEDGGVSQLDVSTALTLLHQGDICVGGRLVDASNATLLCEVSHDGIEARCVYKPIAGERPLWDFPDGSLAGREVASYAVSEAAGWGVVPPTVLREGPFGPGMVQLWMETDPDVELVDVVAPDSVPTGWLRVLDALGSGGRPVVLAHADDDRLRRMALFDVVINNADRKGGHVLPLPDGTLHGVDHGVSFHREHKLRTVLWGWAGEPLRDEEGATLTRLGERLAGDLGTELAALLTRGEVRETHRRIDRLVSDGHLPFPGEGWPAIPWPPF